MKRILSPSSVLCLPLLFATACTPSMPAQTNSVDINAAAMQAQGTVNAYVANAASADAHVVAEPDAPATDTARHAGGNPLAPLDPPAPGTPGGLVDDRTPVSEAPFAADSAQGAANVVQTYYALIEEGKYARAFALRDPGGQPANAAAFAASFAHYSEYHANVGAPGAVDAGAGQRYVTVPVQVFARLERGGEPVYQIGSVTLHRSGDVDGATAVQRSWHIREIDLKSAAKR